MGVDEDTKVGFHRIVGDEIRPPVGVDVAFGHHVETAPERDVLGRAEIPETVAADERQPAIGVDWATEREGEPNTGSIEWTPVVTGEGVLLAVVEVESTDESGEVTGVLAVSDPLTIQGALGVTPRAELGFDAPRPNPGGGWQVLRYGLSRSGPARLAIYDLQGRLVRELVRGGSEAGWHEARWDGSDASLTRVRQGIYLAKFEAEGRPFIRRLARLE